MLSVYFFVFMFIYTCSVLTALCTRKNNYSSPASHYLYSHRAGGRQHIRRRDD